MNVLPNVATDTSPGLTRTVGEEEDAREEGIGDGGDRIRDGGEPGRAAKATVAESMTSIEIANNNLLLDRGAVLLDFEYSFLARTAVAFDLK